MGKNRHRGWRYKDWQQQVFERGNYKCCLCGSTDNITADHISPVATHPELEYDVSNGRVLCDKCRVRDMLISWSKGLFKN